MKKVLICIFIFVNSILADTKSELIDLQKEYIELNKVKDRIYQKDYIILQNDINSELKIDEPIHTNLLNAINIFKKRLGQK